MHGTTASPDLEIIAGVGERVVQGQVTTVDFWVRNTSDHSLTDIQLVTSGLMIGRQISLELGHLEPGQTAHRTIEAKVRESGTGLLNVRSTYRAGSRDRAAHGALRVDVTPSPNREAISVAIHAEKMMGNDLSSWFGADREVVRSRGDPNCYRIELRFATSYDPDSDLGRSTSCASCGKAIDSADDSEICDNCGSSLDEARQSGRLGLEWQVDPVPGGVPRTLNLRLRNEGSNDLGKVRLSLACEDFLRAPRERSFPRLSPGAPRPARFRVEARHFHAEARASSEVQVLAIYEDQKGNANVLRGDFELWIVPPTASEESAAHTDRPWERVFLEYDPAWTIALRAEQHGEEPAPLIEPYSRARDRSFELSVPDGQGRREIRIHVMDRISIGRVHASNVIVPRYLPRSPENDDVSASVSGRHAALVRTGECFALDDSGSTNGTRVGDRVLRTEGCPLSDGATFYVGSPIGYRYTEYRDLRGVSVPQGRERSAENKTSFAYGRHLHDAIESRRDAAPLLAARLRRVDRGSDGVDHVICVRSVLVGSESGAPIVIRGSNVAERHARFRVSGERFCLEDLNSATGTWLDGRLLPPFQPTPLPEDSTVRLGDTEIRVRALAAGAP